MKLVNMYERGFSVVLAHPPDSAGLLWLFTVRIYHPEGPPFLNLTFSSLWGIVSTNLLIVSIDISLSQIFIIAFSKSSIVQLPWGFLFLSRCFKIFQIFSIGLKFGEQGGQSIEYIWHSSLTALQIPWFCRVSVFPWTLLLSSTQKKLPGCSNISLRGPLRIWSAYFFWVKPFLFSSSK